MGLFLIYQGMWVLRDRVLWFNERCVFPSWRRGNFLLASFFCWDYFSHKKQINSTLAICCCNFWSPPRPCPPPQVHHELTCCQDCTGDDGEEAEQDKHWGGVCCKGKGWRYGGEQNVGKNHEDEERADGMRPGCGGVEVISSSIQNIAEERNDFLLDCVCMFKRGDMPWDGWSNIKPSRKITRWIVDCCWGSWYWRICMFEMGMYFSIFYFFYNIKEILTGMLEEYVSD